jgi:opacity protein-like surface antigen
MFDAKLEMGESMHKRIIRVVSAGALACLVLGVATGARAEDGQVSAGFSSNDLGRGSPANDNSGAFLAAGKIGGIASFNGLSPFAIGGIELGYVFGGTQRRIGVMLDVSYTAPSANGSVKESFHPSRVPGGMYDWELRQKELVFQPTFMYRLTGVAGSITPYAGIGPRFYFVEDVTRGSSGGKTFTDSKEQSAKFGFGIPLGAELQLGPGGLFAEFLFQWGPLAHETTGDTHLGSGSLMLGYRALL